MDAPLPSKDNTPRQAYRPPRWLKITVLSTMIVLVVGFVAGVLGIVGLFWYYGRDVEEIDEQALRDYRPPQVTRIVDRQGVLIGELYTQRRTFVPYAKIPAHVENAFLAAEDADFYRHEGMDYVGMVRALLANVRAGAMRQGASTITQQVVKNFLLSQDRTLERKVQELILSRRIEEVLDKSEILELYLNDIYLGHGRYGIEEASLFYFGKGIAEIDLGQAALLATLPKAPSTSTPYKNYEKAKDRQVYVLRQMEKHGFASAEEVAPFIDAKLAIIPRTHADAEADAASLELAASAEVHPGAEEFVDLARAELLVRYGKDQLGRLGATVTMTVDLELQKTARAGLRDGLIAIDHRRGWGHGIKPAKAKNLARAVTGGKGPHEAGKIYPVVIQARRPGLPEQGFPARIGDELNVWVEVPKGSRYDDPELDDLDQFPVDGVTMGRIIALQAPAERGLPAGWGLAEIGSGPEAAVVVADVDSGEVLAMVGGHRFARGDFNRAMQAKRQPGSSFKPFVYGAALASKKFTAASLIEDSPEIYEKWRPTNYEADQYRGEIRMRVALTHSVNTVAIKLLDAVGIDVGIAFARAAGIESPFEPNLSLALGTGEVTPFELLRGYLTLARSGSRIDPIWIRSVEVPGEEPWFPTRTPEQTIDSGVAFVLASLMRSVVDEGTGTAAKKLGVPIAGKTGTAADSRDAWFAGFTDELVAVAWVGFDTPKPMTRETGGKAALPIWLTAMEAAVELELPEADEAIRPAQRIFAPPPSVLVRTIDRATGLLAPTSVVHADGTESPPDPATLLEEYFLPGTEPTQTANPEITSKADVLLDLYGDAPADTLSGEDAMVGRDDPAAEPFDAAPAEAEPDEPALPSIED
jgi:penicillin-binding protein 1A